LGLGRRAVTCENLANCGDRPHRPPVASHLYYCIILYCMTVCAPSRRGINASPTSVTCAEQQSNRAVKTPESEDGDDESPGSPFPRFPCNPLFRPGLIISLLSTGDAHPQAQLLANRAIARNLIRGVVVDGVVRCLRSSVNCCRNTYVLFLRMPWCTITLHYIIGQ